MVDDFHEYYRALELIENAHCMPRTIEESFNEKLFYDKVDDLCKEYHIKSSKKPSSKHKKRVAILLSNAFLESSGSVHWAQEFEAWIMKLQKDMPLQCDELEIESNDRTYRCKRKGSMYGRTISATQFDNNAICDKTLELEPLPIAKAILNFIVIKEEKENVKSIIGTVTNNKQRIQSNNSRRRATRALKDKQVGATQDENSRSALHRINNEKPRLLRRRSRNVDAIKKKDVR